MIPQQATFGYQCKQTELHELAKKVKGEVMRLGKSQEGSKSSTFFGSMMMVAVMSVV